MESATDIRADINTKYRCVSTDQVHMHNVTVTLRDATIQAYLANSSFSKEGRVLPLTRVPSPSSGGCTRGFEPRPEEDACGRARAARTELGPRARIAERVFLWRR